MRCHGNYPITLRNNNNISTSTHQFNRDNKSMKSSKRTLSIGEREDLLIALQERFEKNMRRHKGLEWANVLAKLDPPAGGEKLWSLNEMEISGGEPDVIVGNDKKTGEYIFYDCSAESPKGRRGLFYDGEALASRQRH